MIVVIFVRIVMAVIVPASGGLSTHGEFLYSRASRRARN